ncbi:hypothetical protein L6452_13529 [Arctium lappa]|uniref:Uncharacterized protein n=1 Tax=Arctium lappa TaxID=4217 RepID=A0ACB9CII7_ARCLA|nr:hypothetical protein L6452_13529 [Arctium lappa]
MRWKRGHNTRANIPNCCFDIDCWPRHPPIPYLHVTITSSGSPFPDPVILVLLVYLKVKSDTIRRWYQN